MLNVSPGASTSRITFTSRDPAPGAKDEGPAPATNVMRSASADTSRGRGATDPAEPDGTNVASPASSNADGAVAPLTRTAPGPLATKNIGGESL